MVVFEGLVVASCCRWVVLTWGPVTCVLYIRPGVDVFRRSYQVLMSFYLSLEPYRTSAPKCGSFEN